MSSSTTISIPFNDYPATKFASIDEATTEVKRVATDNGFSLVTRSTMKHPKDKMIVERLYLGCHLHGIHRPMGVGIRNTSSQRIGCTYQIAIRRTRDKYSATPNDWFYKIDGNVTNHNIHNHLLEEGREQMRGYSAARKLTEDEAQKVNLLANSAIKPRQIRSIMAATNPDILVGSTEIANQIQKNRREELDGNTATGALLQILTNRTRYIAFSKVDEKRRLTHVFWMDIQQLVIFRRYHEVLILDCTYKSNTYGMPLFDVAGRTSTNNSYILANALLRSEKGIDYYWVMKCLKDSLYIDVDKWKTSNLPSTTSTIISGLSDSVPPSPKLPATTTSTDNTTSISIPSSPVLQTSSNSLSVAAATANISTESTTEPTPDSNISPLAISINTLQSIQKDDYPLPLVFVTDCEEALMNALQLLFPDTANLLCKWHIMKNIAIRQKSDISALEWKVFMGYLSLLFAAKTMPIFNELWAKFSDNTLDTGMWDAVNRNSRYLPGDKLLYRENLPATWEKDVGNYLDKLAIDIDKNKKIKILSTSSHQRVFDYIEATWYPHRQKFVSCWIDNVLHLNTTTTSRVEGIHHSIKSNLQSSRVNLLTLFRTIDATTTSQRKKFQETIQSQRLRLLIKYTGKYIFENIHRKVTYLALNLMQRQVQICDARLLEKEMSNGLITPPCSKSFITSMGLPCSHEIERYREEKKSIELHDIDKHWWLDDDISNVVEFSGLILNPAIQHCRGRKPGKRFIPLSVRSTARAVAAFDDSTRREPAANEPRKLYEPSLENEGFLAPNSLAPPPSTAPSALSRERSTSRKRMNSTANTEANTSRKEGRLLPYEQQIQF